MKINEMTTEHIKNRIAYCKRFLATKPDPGVFNGISDFGDDWVEQENRVNDRIEEDVLEHIKDLEKELSFRD